MKKILFLILILSFSFRSNTQEKTSNSKSYFEDFTNSDHGWYIDKKSRSYIEYATQNNNLNVTQKKNFKRKLYEFHSVLSPLNFNTNKDFEIKTMLERPNGGRYDKFGLIWNYKNDKNYSIFIIDIIQKVGSSENAGSWRYHEFHEGKASAGNAYGVFEINRIAKKRPITLKVIKRQDLYVLFVNEVVVGTITPKEIGYGLLTLNSFNESKAGIIYYPHDNSIIKLKNQVKMKSTIHSFSFKNLKPLETNLNIDSTPPAINITSISGGGNQEMGQISSMVTIEGNFKDSSAIIFANISIKPGLVAKKIKVDENGHFSIPLNLPSLISYVNVKNYLCEIIASDASGNKKVYRFKFNDKDIRKGPLKENENDNSPPTITIIAPQVNRGFSIVKNTNNYKVVGNVIDQNKITKVLLNNKEVTLDANGTFTKSVSLAYGENTFTVEATDEFKNRAKKTFTIKQELENKESIVTDNKRKKTKADVITTGKYYALIIGNNEYKDQAIASLDEPIKDATKLYNVLTKKYAFSPENVTLLQNASYVETITAFDKLGNTLTANDNLLVFYAGHGWWDETKDLGYWLPTDARKSNTAFWIRNSTISDYMASIKTKHTLLIADACFSGSIFKTRAAFDDASLAIKKLNDLTSKTAMTSGNLKEVPDQSVFLKYLVKRLSDNTEKYLPADKLFSSFRIAVMNNSPNAPQFGTIQNAGDEGGEFIFVKKE